MQSKYEISPGENKEVKSKETSRTPRLYHLRPSVSPVCQHQSKTPRVARGRERRGGVGARMSPTSPS